MFGGVQLGYDNAKRLIDHLNDNKITVDEFRKNLRLLNQFDKLDMEE